MGPLSSVQFFLAEPLGNGEKMLTDKTVAENHPVWRIEDPE
jgi:hypothetical protein